MIPRTYETAETPSLSCVLIILASDATLCLQNPQHSPEALFLRQKL